MINYQGFHVVLSTEEDFSSCAQYEKETLPNSIEGSCSSRHMFWKYLMIKSSP
jgi:hypothetical protein